MQSARDLTAPLPGRAMLHALAKCWSTRPRASFVSHILSVICAKLSRQRARSLQNPTRSNQGAVREPLLRQGETTRISRLG